MAAEKSNVAADDDAAFAEGAITVWANLLTLIAGELRAQGVPPDVLLEMLALLNRTNQATIRSPRAKASASRHIESVCRAIRKA
ncbi:hypothetical protein [Sphingopyxis sp. MSC1_008]|uniref:hypothetical protein n=1 Tax=Sphingopyxis sp. MSC1_008 TaxID=2909265 RepID=UPI0020BD4FBA|nr:hypothetical protein [Sphingopyxis sp. MSC1_008]